MTSSRRAWDKASRSTHPEPGNPQVRIATEVPEGAVNFGFHRNVGGPEQPTPVLLPREAHVMTFAPTGAGKTVSCVVPALLQHEGPAIVLDPKGEIAAITARRRREMGQDVHVVDPFGVSGLPSSGFNPLDLVEPDAPEAVDEAKVLTTAMLPPKWDARDAFWRSRATYLLTAATLSTVSDHPLPGRNLTTTRDIVHGLARAANRSQAAAVCETATTIVSRNADVARINDLMNLGAVETIGGIVHTALEGVAFVQGPLVERCLRNSSFRLDDVTEGTPMTIYLVLPPHMLLSHGVMLRLWLNALFGALMRRRAGPALPTLLMLDEAAQLGPFDPLQTAITLLRGYGVQTWSLWQDPGQLIELYPQGYRTMLNNCRVLQFFGATSDVAWRQAGSLMGVETDRLDLGGSDRMLLVRDGQPIVADRIDYRTDLELARHADPNPRHAPPTYPLRRRLPTCPAESTASVAPVSAMGDIAAALGSL